ncbi:MAG: hypothetical protein HY255_06695 [Betaproteobacteria bacterium]|nr:hypothetical protein [Betaproteobacteria bacterium]
MDTASRLTASALVGALSTLSLALASGEAGAKNTTPPSFGCGGSPPQLIYLKPVPKLSNAEFTNQGADCAMWQTFFYLNWPAVPGKRGVPNTKAKFGAAGATVWETFMTEDQVFLPNGAKPQPWSLLQGVAGMPKSVGRQLAGGQLRMLNRTSKVSHAVAHLSGTMLGRNSPGIPLDEIRQADNNILYDQQKVPVYYDVAMNQTQFSYIYHNGLYNSDKQIAYASKSNILLPTGSIEVKAAWKVLTATEAASGRFHTAKGYLPGPSGQAETVTIGLVGFHVFASGGKETAGLWATFYQIDNAPLTGVPGKGPYSFNNPASTTPPNTVGTNPTQVVQMFADDSVAEKVNGQAQKIIIEGYAKSPWQYYAMVDSQWSRSVLTPPAPPAPVPLAFGMASTETLVNPVLETFMQKTGFSCLGCHSGATTAQDKSTTAAGFSFMFGNATAAKKP